MDIIHEDVWQVLPVVAFDTWMRRWRWPMTATLWPDLLDLYPDLNVAMKAIKGLKFGETYINRGNFEAMQGFHAGWRKSGIGGADGRHGLNEYLQTQVVYLQSSAR